MAIVKRRRNSIEWLCVELGGRCVRGDRVLPVGRAVRALIGQFVVGLSRGSAPIRASHQRPTQWTQPLHPFQKTKPTHLR